MAVLKYIVCKMGFLQADSPLYASSVLTVSTVGRVWSIQKLSTVRSQGGWHYDVMLKAQNVMSLVTLFTLFVHLQLSSSTTHLTFLNALLCLGCFKLLPKRNIFHKSHFGS